MFLWGDYMENVLGWIKDNTNYNPVVLDQSIDHSRIVKVKGYIPIHKKYTVQLLKDVPTLSGVYIFFDQDNGLIYVGKTNRLRERVNAHIRGNTNTQDIKHKFYKVAFIRCIEYEAKEIEKELINQFQPYGNIVGVTN